MRLPVCSRNILTDRNGGKVWKWDVLRRLFGQKVTSGQALASLVRACGPSAARDWDLSGLANFVDYELDDAERGRLFGFTVPNMLEIALEMETLFRGDILLLKQNRQQGVTLTRKEVLCLLVHAFFCTFPRRSEPKRGQEVLPLPGIHFNRLFEGSPSSRTGVHPVTAAKLRCLFHYFDRACSDPPKGDLHVFRKVASRPPEWESSRELFRDLEIAVSGTLEDDAPGQWQADFANKNIGGGVLGHGAVQEEILFCIFPELIVTRLFVETLLPNEALLMIGAERYSQHKGYASTFRFAGPYYDNTPVVAKALSNSGGYGGHGFYRDRTIFAFDALHFKHGSEDQQFRPELIHRELFKSFVAFKPPPATDVIAPPVATGNWGCGVFLGDKDLKAAIQLLAAAETRRDLKYFTYGDEDLAARLRRFHTRAKQSKVTVSTVARLVFEYGESGESECKLLDWLAEKI